MTNPSSSLQNTSLAQRFLSGAAWSFSGKILTAAASLAANALLARLLSPEEMGTYFLAFSLVAILSISGQWGLNRGLVKLVASELAKGHSALARNGIIASFIIVISISLLIVLFLISPAGDWTLAKVSGSSLLVSISFLVGLWILIKAIQGLVSESFRGFHDIRLATIFGGLVATTLSMSFFLILWLLHGSADLAQVVQMTVLAAGISLLIGLLFLFHKMKNLDRGGRVPLSKVVRFGFPLFLTSVSLFGVKELHIWVLAMLQPETEVALYGSAIRLVTLLAMPLIIVNSVLPPMVATLYSQNKYSQVQRVLQKAATLMTVPALILCTLILVFGGDALAIIYGEHYREAFVPLAILAAGQFINILTGSPGVLLTMSGHERVVMSSALTTGVIGILVSFACVPEFGATGAAIGYSVGIALLNVSMWAYSYFRLSICTHGSLQVMREIIRKGRARIEFDWANGGSLSFLDNIIRPLEKFWWKIWGYKIIECLGDSHVSIYRSLNYKPWVGKRRFCTTSVRGATAYGIGNPNSTTNALQVFEERLKKCKKESIILFMMGEVDVGFLVWLRAKKHGKNPIDCMEEAWQRYTDFLEQVKLTHPKLIVCSAPLPTIKDGEKHGTVANARSEITATQHERTAMTLEFNRRLSIWANKIGITYIDFDEFAIDKDTQLIKSSLLNHSTVNHHYDKEAFHSLIKKVIASIA